MSKQRPNLLDLRSVSNNSVNSATSSKSVRSPRMHITGEAPPELSPLDAFAMQSRLLARQLQDSAKDGNRISRLPPLTVESPLIIQGRSDYFRSMSTDGESDNNESPEHKSPEGLGLRTELEDPFESDRPMSMHPRMSRIPPTPDEDVPALPRSLRDSSRGRELRPVEETRDFLGPERQRSPSPLQNERNARPERAEPSSARSGKFSVSSYSDSPEKLKYGPVDELGLAPPQPSFTRRPSSVTSSPLPPRDEDGSGHLSGSFHSLPPRKLSSSSGAFAPPMASPSLSSLRRTESISSDTSALPRPSFNFSRPLSRSGTPSLDPPSRQASSDSHPSFVLADDSVQTPMSMHSEVFLEQQTHDSDKSPASSYIYSKFSLPRGKLIQRSEDAAPQTQVSSRWEQSTLLPPSGVRAVPPDTPPSPPSRPVSAYARSAPDPDAVSMMSSMPRPSLDVGKRSMDVSQMPSTQLRSSLGRPLFDATRLSMEEPRGRLQGRGRSPPSTNTSDTASTIRPPPTSGTILSASEMSAEEHLAKGIQCHESGSLNESTYHLRHAARLGEPTAMLLYALACRHGWGMRANQREGVQWLRKAAEHAGVDIADDEGQVKEGKRVDVLSMKTHKAQFALSIYELGVSHMNGWGIEQDKTLALRCFEIAGTWGDVDALAEAGFCYAQGVGCKKDLKKSSKFYRMAEAKGMSMVGNSWIHKSKYNDEEDKPAKKDKKKARSKSRTRTMFGLKHSS